MKVLFLTDRVPFPPRSGDQLRVANMLQRVAAKHDVWLGAMTETEEQVAAVPEVAAMCAGVEIVPQVLRHPLAHVPGLLRFALAGKPPELKFYYYADLARRLRQLWHTIDFDVLHVEREEVALYESDLAGGRARRLLVCHNVGYSQYRRIAAVERQLGPKLRASLYSMAMKRWEPAYAERFDHTVTVSELDKQELLALNPRLRVTVIPNGVDTRLHRPLPAAGPVDTLLFIGSMNYTPCVDGAIFLARQVLPLLRTKGLAAETWIVGANPAPEVRQLGGAGVHVTGRVPDVVPYYERSGIAVVPLRAGGGTRLKVLEAMALGRPLVSTTIGCEGIDAVDGEHLLIADTPERFAEQIERLARDRDLYERIRANARRLVEERYDWDALAEAMMSLYQPVEATNRGTATHAR